MAISTTNLADRTIGMVIVAQDGSGDFNGSTDVTIQAAIDSLPNGGWIFIKEGVYLIDTNIIPTDGIRLSGSGNLTVLKQKDLAATTRIIYATTVVDLIIEDMKLDGNSAGQVGDKSGITLTGNYNLVIRNLYITDCLDYGIIIAGNIGQNYISDCFIEDCGVAIKSTLDNLVIRNVNADTDVVGAAGIEMENQHDGAILNCWVISNNAVSTAYRLHGSTHQITVLGCRCRNIRNGYLEEDTTTDNILDDFMGTNVPGDFITLNVGSTTRVGLNLLT